MRLGENVRIRPLSREKAETVVKVNDGGGAQESEYKCHKIRMTFSF